MRYLSASVAVAVLTSALAGAPGPTRAQRLQTAALAQVGVTTEYDGSYRSIRYPGGDVPKKTGVCTDVVIRAYRDLGLDLQKLVHEDMKAHFDLYPKKWGLRKTDPNIDHRRVANLQRFFARKGKVLAVSNSPKEYLAGDLVAWDLNGRGLLHIGIVVEPPGLPGRRWIVHNVGSGTRLEDRLFDWKLLGHYRYGLD